MPTLEIFVVDLISQHLKAWESLAVCKWVKKNVITYANKAKDAERRLGVRLSYPTWKLNFLYNGESKRAAPLGFITLFFLTMLGKRKSRRDYFEDNLLLHKTVILPWRAMHSFCYFCRKKEKKSFRKMSLPHAPCNESLWQHKWVAPVVHSLPFQK